MKRLSLTIMLLIAPAALMADILDRCEIARAYAETVMVFRQSEMPMEETIGYIQPVELPEVKGLAIKFIHRAYQRPIFHGKEHRDDEVERFSKEVYSECVDWSVK